MEEVFELFALRYMVSNFGNVDSLNYCGKGKRKRMSPNTNNSKGYERINLTIDGVEKSFSVHRLVAMCFIPNPNNYEQVNHIDGNKLNNNVSNLEWCSNQQNNHHAWKIGLMKPCKGEKNGQAKITEAIVIEIFRLRNVEKWLLREIADKFGITETQVSYILNRKKWNHVNIPNAYLKKQIKNG